MVPPQPSGPVRNSLAAVLLPAVIPAVIILASASVTLGPIVLAARLLLLRTARAALLVGVLVQVVAQLQPSLGMVVQWGRCRVVPPCTVGQHLGVGVTGDVGVSVQHRMVCEPHRLLWRPLRLLSVGLPTPEVHLVATVETPGSVVGATVWVLPVPARPTCTPLVPAVLLIGRWSAL